MIFNSMKKRRDIDSIFVTKENSCDKNPIYLEIIFMILQSKLIKVGVFILLLALAYSIIKGDVEFFYGLKFK